MTNKTIFKFELKVTGKQVIKLPARARILSLQTQNNIPYIWVLVNCDETETEERYIFTFQTGEPINDLPKNLTDFIGTYQISGEEKLSSYVFHVFECIGVLCF